MEIDVLADWHREQAEKIKNSRKNDIDKSGAALRKFHLDAAALIGLFSQGQRERFLAETSRTVMIGAMESFERTAKILLSDAKDLKKMLSEEESD